ncbi:MAG: RluA family pseudouridine synthase [Clostridia bacterium]|nr:RluA family pseudouridine synthase [Clostridia bacterium]
MPVISHVIAEAEAGRTVKSIALKEMRLSRGRFSSLKFSGGLLLNGQPARADRRVMAGQTLSAQWEDARSAALTPCEAPLSIPWQDGHYFIIDKPAPLPTLCSARQEGPTLENALFSSLGCPERFVFRPVNRLDKGTSGLLAAAKDAHAQQLLQRQLHTDSFIREYLAVCEGRLPRAEGVINLPIGKSGEGIRREIRQDGLRAVTHYRVEQEKEKYSLVRLRLKTGRTHQIRVHLAALGCPVVGDYLYGTPSPALPGRFALHACFLQFRHPLTGETVSVSSPLPEALSELVNIQLHHPRKGTLGLFAPDPNQGPEAPGPALADIT